MEDHHGDAQPRRTRPVPMYGLNSNQSSSSVFEDVEMAQDQVYLLIIPCYIKALFS